MLKLVNLFIAFWVIVVLCILNVSGRYLFASDNTESYSRNVHEHDEQKGVCCTEQENHSSCDNDHADEDEHISHSDVGKHSDYDHDHHLETDQNISHENDDHSDHAENNALGYDEHAHENIIELDHETETLIAIKTIKAQKGTLDTVIRLTGKIGLNEDRVAHVVPYVSGIVQQVSKKLGDQVRTGESIAVIHSRELSEAKAEYLASVQRYQLTQSVYDRENKLWQQNISSEQEFIRAKIDFTQAEINKTLAEQKLYVFGLDRQSINNLQNEPHNRFIEYRITVPFDGVIIEKHITHGEVVKSDSPVFTIADLDTVWVDFDVFSKDLSYVKKGQTFVISAGNEKIQAAFMFISPVLNNETLTATARAVLDNSNGKLYPGQFVTAQLNAKEHSGRIVLPQNAVQVVDGKKSVFVKKEHDYELREVTIGKSNREKVEIMSGLKEGEPVVTDGAFELKSKIVTSTLDSHAGHGH